MNKLLWQISIYTDRKLCVGIRILCSAFEKKIDSTIISYIEDCCFTLVHFIILFISFVFSVFYFKFFFRFKLRGIIIVSVNELDHNTLIYLELNKRLSFGDHLKGTKSRRCHRKKKQLIHNLGNIYTFHQLVSIGISERCKTTILYWFCSRPNHWLGARFVVVLSCALALSPIHYYVVVVNVIRTQCFPFVSLFHSTEWQSTFWWPLPWPMPTDILWRSIYFSCLWNFLS